MSFSWDVNDGNNIRVLSIGTITGNAVSALKEIILACAHSRDSELDIVAADSVWWKVTFRKATSRQPIEADLG